MLWLSLIGTLGLQAVAMHWPPASSLFGTTGMAWSDRGIAIGAGSTVLLFEEMRKLASRTLRPRKT